MITFLLTGNTNEIAANIYNKYKPHLSEYFIKYQEYIEQLTSQNFDQIGPSFTWFKYKDQ